MMLIYPLVLLLSIQAAVARQLLMIECITRHGVRHPQFPNEHDHSNQSFPIKELTPEGRQMHYLLGRLLHRTYWHQLFPEQPQKQRLNRSLIYAKSTDTNRTIQSLENLLYGFLADVEPENDPLGPDSQFLPPYEGVIGELDKDIFFKNWQRSHNVPIHVQKGMDGQKAIIRGDNQGDFLAKQEASFCPNQLLWQEQAQNAPWVLELMERQQIQRTVTKLQEYYPGVALDFSTIFKYVDNYYCLKAMGKSFLQIFENEKYRQYLDYLYIARLYAIFLSTEIQIKTFSKTLLETTIYNMRLAADGKGPKMIFYSGHDSTIAILLAALNFTTLPCLYDHYMLNKTAGKCYWKYPPFASSFVFELWQEDNNSLSIEITINGQKQQIPVCNYAKACSLDAFEEWFQINKLKITPNEACGVSEEQAVLLVPMVGIILVFFVGLCSFFVSRRAPRRAGERRVPSMDEIVSEQ